MHAFRFQLQAIWKTVQSFWTEEGLTRLNLVACKILKLEYQLTSKVQSRREGPIVFETSQNRLHYVAGAFCMRHTRSPRRNFRPLWLCERFLRQRRWSEHQHHLHATRKEGTGCLLSRLQQIDLQKQNAACGSGNRAAACGDLIGCNRRLLNLVTPVLSCALLSRIGQ